MARAAILTTDGVDETHLEYVYYRLREDAVLTSVATPDGSPPTGIGGRTWEDAVPVSDLETRDAYDFVIVPGGRAPERLRRSESAIDWLRAYHHHDGIVGVIGHGVQLLASIDALEGRTVTAPPEVAIDVENAGAIVTDEAVAVDGRLVTARDTAALPFFVSATMSNALIPQDPAQEAQERPHWEVSE